MNPLPISLGHRVVAAPALFLLAACSSVHTLSISSEPTGAMIQVDGQNIGEAPLSHTIDFGAQRRTVVGAMLPGYSTEEVGLREESGAVATGELNLVLREDQAWQVTTTSEATNQWLRLQMDSANSEETIWQKLVDSITDRYPSLEQLDRSSGYLRTIYRTRTFQGPRRPFRVRNRFICTIASREPMIYKMKIEAERTDSQGNWIEYGRVFKEDAELVEELAARLGIK